MPDWMDLSDPERAIFALEVGLVVFGVVSGAGVVAVGAQGLRSAGRFLVTGWLRRRAGALVLGSVVGWLLYPAGETTESIDQTASGLQVACVEVTCRPSTVAGRPLDCLWQERDASDGERLLGTPKRHQRRVLELIRDAAPSRICVDATAAGWRVEQWWLALSAEHSVPVDRGRCGPGHPPQCVGGPRP
jgi:hypothetical protein